MSIRHDNVPRLSAADDFHRSVDDELNRHWHTRPDPYEGMSRVIGVAARWALAILVALAVVLFLGLAFLEGLARAEARPASCDGLRGAECAAAVAEGVQR